VKGRGSPPLLKYDSTGRPVAAAGIGLTIFPHGLFVDREGNLWITDGRGKGDIGHTVHKLSPDGNVLMTMGTPGKGGDAVNQFNAPSDVIVAPNGDIFVADGHGDKTNARIVKLTKDGKYVKAWGREGKGQSEFDQSHGIAMDSQGRLFVADRANSRIQIFDQEGTFIAEWKQFGRPSGVAIDKNDVLYVADSQSTQQSNPGFQQGIRIGSAKDGKVTAFIPETVDLGSLEGVGYDDAGNVYAGYTNKMNLKRFVKK
jgi:sugar lactone lactonase YvrE